MLYPELEIFKEFRQVIVWGFPLHTHTHSYIHGAWVKTFQYLGIQVYWFHDKDYPINFDYTNTCFITEGWADDNIPIEKSSTYFVHIAKNPGRYLDKGARLIEIRYNVKEINDYNYSYKLPNEKAIHLSESTLYESVPDDSAVALKRGRSIKNTPYEVIYMYWATDLLPYEFNYEDTTSYHEPIIHYIGTIDSQHPFNTFRLIAQQNGIQVVHHDPWRNPISYEENIRLMKQSYCAPDFRTHGQDDKRAEYGIMNGTNHIDIGYIPCRVFKAISYGHTGITNSLRVKEVLGKYVEYCETPYDILPIVEKRKNDVEWRKESMKYVAENHTYIQRVRDLARAISMKVTPVTCVTAFYDIGREAIDGRSIMDYKSYLIKTLQCITAPFVLFLDPTLGWKDELLHIRSSVGPIQIIELPFSETIMWIYKDQIESILKSTPHINPKDITNLLPEYTIIQYNKFDFLERAISENPFNSQHFCWLDAGISRFIDSTKKYMSKNIVTAHFNVVTTYSSIPTLQPDTYIGTNTCILKGTCLYMSSSIFQEVKNEVMRIWKDEMIAKDRIDNEQIALALAYQTIPHIFKLHTSNEQVEKLIQYVFEEKI